MKIAVLTDSSIGREILVENSDIHMVPLMITKENGEQIRDDIDLSPDEFYKLLDKELLKTSLSIPGEMLAKWDELLKEYDQVIVALLSKGLSGQFQTFKMFANEEQYLNKVFVVDTNGVSIVLENIVAEILNKVNEGKEAGQVLEEIEAINQNFITYIIPKSLERLLRGGRISKAAAAMAKILKIIPILKYNGQIDKETKTRTFKKAINQALELIKNKTDDVEIIDLSYSRTDEETLEMVKQLIELNGFKLGRLRTMPNVITCHTGRDTYALVAWMK